MSWLDRVLSRRRVVLSLAAILSLIGAVAWQIMVRQEDPRLRPFWGQVVVPFPGADAELVERLVLEPVEDHLAEVSQINWVRSTAYAEMAVVFMELRQDTGDTDEAWSDVRNALSRARPEFPEGVGEPVLNDQLEEQESIVLAVTGDGDPLVLLDGARRLRHELLSLPSVAKVHLVGDPGEQVTVDVDDALARRLGVTAPLLAAQLAARNRIIPGGSLAIGGKTVRLRPVSEFGSVAEIGATPVALPSGTSVPLSTLARVRIGPQEPAAPRMRLNDEVAVGLGVVPRPGINVVRFGKVVRQRVAAVAPDLAPLVVSEVAYQPARVEARLSQLSRSLLFGVVVVAGVLVLAMGLRLGLLVASVVPLVASASLAIYALGGGVLHQISIAALVLALGMLVDNAIVVAENVQWRLDEGESAADATRGAVKELAIPLAGATATTLAAFVPMLLSLGPTADFTRSIPVVVMLTIAVSYLFALLVTPALAETVLRPAERRGSHALAPVAGVLTRLAVRRSGLVVAAAATLVVASLAGAGFVKRQFFPSSDRNLLVVDLRAPEGTHLEATAAISRRLERALLSRPEVISVAGFIGRSAPHFYYNLPQIPWSPHYAQIVVETHDTSELDGLLDWCRRIVDEELPLADVVVRKLEQGPPVEAPIEVRLFGDDPAELYAAATGVAAELRAVEGTVDVRHDLGPGAPTLRIVVEDAQAARHGITRADVARSLYGSTRGLPLGDLYGGDDPIPVVFRGAGETLPAVQLTALDVAGLDGRVAQLGGLARVEAEWRPAAIHHRDRRRVVTVSSQLADGAAYSDVLAGLEPRLAQLDLPAGVTTAFGGEAEGAGEANAALVGAFPIGGMLLLGVLLAEFNSFRRLAIIMTTVPLAATGVVPGLLLSGQPFGFMSLLGVIALIGIVVNNAIVLLEVVEARRREGASVAEALGDAVHRRLRPILLTTGTTVAGLLPLALSQSTLWPPLAWAMISGLLASTVFTLLVVPALYRLLLDGGRRLRSVAGGTLIAALLLSAGGANASETERVTLEEAMARASVRPAVAAAAARARAAARIAVGERRAATLPVVTVIGSVSERDRELTLVTPIGDFPFGAARVTAAALELSQPLIDVSRQLHGTAAAARDAEAAALTGRREAQLARVRAAAAFLDVVALDASLRATEAYVISLEGRTLEVRAMVDAGRALEADALKVELALAEARQDLLGLEQARAVARRALGVAVGADGPTEPAGDLPVVPAPPTDLDAAVAAALASRSDLAALTASTVAAEKRAAAVRAEILPRLDASARWSWTDGSPYAEKSWAEGAVRIVWTPFAAATRAPRAEALAEQAAALRAELEEARRAVTVEVGRAVAAVVTAVGAADVAGRGVDQAMETRRVEAERHRAGRSTTNDLLAAEAEVRRQRTRRDLAAAELVRAWIDLGAATGREQLLP